MKLEISFDDITVGEWGETLTETIRSEIRNQIVAMVRKEVKAQKAEWEKTIQKQVRSVLKAITPADLERMAREAMK